MKRLFNIISVGDLVKIDSNCPNTRKPIFEVYAIVKAKNGISYILKGEKGLHEHLFKKYELTKCKY